MPADTPSIVDKLSHCMLMDMHTRDRATGEGAAAAQALLVCGSMPGDAAHCQLQAPTHASICRARQFCIAGVISIIGLQSATQRRVLTRLGAQRPGAIGGKGRWRYMRRGALLHSETKHGSQCCCLAKAVQAPMLDRGW